MNLIKKSVTRIIQAAMDEDRVHHDITSQILVRKTQISQAYIISREDAVICGNPIVKEILKQFDSKTRVVLYHKDGDLIKKNEPVIFLKGPTSSLLACERIILNFLGHFSGIATLTFEFVKKTKATKAKILDTRKTTPGLRDLEKYAVRCGGGFNHRQDLNDMVLIKDNHLAARDSELSLSNIVRQVRRKTNKKIEIEVDTLEQFKEALTANPDIILLDNMNLSELKTAVLLKKHKKSKVELEASGGVNLKNVAHIAKTGVNRISIGLLTHSAKSTDFSMEFVI